jgi:hypothetical protein|tara:strand:+ start:330 stop:773 length:444 start_codon:yes stop_codon:yes gene_type:complete
MKYLVTFLLAAISATSFAQGRLQFNEIVTYVDEQTYSVTGFNWSSEDTIQVYTVPPGKVVKISSISWSSTYISGSSCVNNNIAKSAYTINGTPVDTDVLKNSWLNSGDELKFYYNASLGGYGGGGNSTCSTNFKNFVSIIEYNIIPE